MQLTQRQEQILKAAVEIIAEHGIQELTIKRLSGRIGVSEPALYRHFTSKHAILEAILERFAGSAAETLAQIADSELSPPDKLRAVFLRFTERFTESPAVSAVVFAEEIFKNERVLSDWVMQIMHSAESRLRLILSAGVESGVFRDDVPLDHLTLVFLGSLRLLVTRWRLRGYDFNLREEGAALVESVLTTLSA